MCFVTSPYATGNDSVYGVLYDPRFDWRKLQLKLFPTNPNKVVYITSAITESTIL